MFLFISMFVCVCVYLCFSLFQIIQLINALIQVASDPDKFQDHSVIFDQIVIAMKKASNQLLNSLFTETRNAGQTSKKW